MCHNQVIGTSPGDNCDDGILDDGAQNAWPPDIGGPLDCHTPDARTTILDALCFEPVLGGPYNPRHDLNVDGKVNILDVPMYKPVLGKSPAPTRTSPAFLAAVQPLTAVVSVGRDNGYGLPSPETLERLEPRPVFRTDLHGDIEISTDERRVWVETERGRK